MRMIWWLGVGIVATVLSIGGAQRAEACSPVYPGVRSRGAFPLADARDVPTTVRPVVGYDGPVQTAELGLILRGPDGMPVAADVVHDGLDFQIVPKAPLAPFTRYEIVDRLAVPCGPLDPQPCTFGEAKAFSAFTTGAGTDTEPPTFQGVGKVEDPTADVCTSDGCCGRRRNVRVRVAWPAAVDNGGPHLRYELRLVQGKRKGGLTGPFFVRGSSQTLAVNCEGYQDPTYQTIQPEPTVVAIRVFDLSGNVTANPSEVRIDVRCSDFFPDLGSGGTRGDAAADASGDTSTDSGCACSLGTHDRGPAGALAILLAFALPALRRRRHM